MHICAEFGDLKMFEWFFDEFKLNINIQNKAKETPFIVAAREGHIELVKLIMENDKYSKAEGFKVDQESLDGWTAFSYAAVNGYFSVVEYLATKAGANINTKDRLQRNPLHWAARYGNVRMASLLLRLGVCFESIDFQ